MAKRVTIMLEEELDKKVRLLQAKLIREEAKSVSFSSVINNILAKEFKH